MEMIDLSRLEPQETLNHTSKVDTMIPSIRMTS